MYFLFFLLSPYNLKPNVFFLSFHQAMIDTYKKYCSSVTFLQRLIGSHKLMAYREYKKADMHFQLCIYVSSASYKPLFIYITFTFVFLCAGGVLVVTGF